MHVRVGPDAVDELFLFSVQQLDSKSDVPTINSPSGAAHFVRQSRSQPRARGNFLAAFVPLKYPEVELKGVDAELMRGLRDSTSGLWGAAVAEKGLSAAIAVNLRPIEERQAGTLRVAVATGFNDGVAALKYLRKLSATSADNKPVADVAVLGNRNAAPEDMIGLVRDVVPTVGDVKLLKSRRDTSGWRANFARTLRALHSAGKTSVEAESAIPRSPSPSLLTRGFLNPKDDGFAQQVVQSMGERANTPAHLLFPRRPDSGSSPRRG
ncbi:MAG: hypothetical protein HOQ05_01025 [Corynebacteriales bacterium]|nr:hypothetical protein [Mycobacteriales bacterium]